MPNKKQSIRSAVLALVVLVLIWGYSWVVMKQGLKYSGPFDFVALRTVFGAVTLFIALVLLRKPLRPVELKATFVLGLLQTAGFTGFSQWALVGEGAGKTAVLAYTMPFWVLILAWVWLHERIKGLQWLAVALALAGLIFILDPWNLHSSLWSNLLAVLAGVSWAASAILVKKLRARTEVDLLSLTAWQMLLGSLVITILAMAVPAKPIQFTPYFIGALAYSAVLATGLGWLLWLYVLEKLPAGTAGLSVLAVPVTGVLLASIELGERPAITEAIGMVLIAAALALLSVLGIRQHTRIEPAEGQE